MPSDIWKLMLTNNPSLHNKSLHARTKVAQLSFSEGLRGLCRDMLWLTKTENAGIMQKRFFCSQERESKKAKEPLYNNDFQKVVVYNSIPDVLCDLHTSKCKIPHNRPYDACLWKLEKRNKFRTSKQLRFVASTKPAFISWTKLVTLLKL